MLGGIGYLKSRQNKKVFKLFLKTGKELAVLRSNGKLFQTIVGQLPKNNVWLTQCYKMVQKDVVLMTAENVKVHIGPRLLPDNPVVA